MTEFSPTQKPFADKTQAKFYLSPDAQRRLAEVAKRTKLSQSVIVDTLITDHCRVAGETAPTRNRRSFDL